MSWILRKFKQREELDKTTIMMRNGENILKELIAASGGKYNPYCIFSAQELKIATNNYDSQKIIRKEGGHNLYKGFWKERSISVMKFNNDLHAEYECCINNIVYASQMSHNHILRLIGFCLETEIPTLVFESVEYGTLRDHIFNSAQILFEPLLLINRLKIAMNIADAVAYLHVGFPRPIILRNIKLSNILFTEQNIVKLFDFSLAKSIPEGETHVTTDELAGTPGYIAPEYFATSEYNEKCDVYTFGLFLLDLLTGQKRYDIIENDGDARLRDHVKRYIENNRFNEIVDPIITEDRSWQQLLAFGEIALQCISMSPGDRPTMVDVAKQLRQIYRSCSCI